MTENARTALQQVMALEPFGVLATSNKEQPYSNLVAFAASDDLRNIVFATSKSTQKYRNILANRYVALLVDNRNNYQSDLLNAIAITALGTAAELQTEQQQHLVRAYIVKHSSLADFLGRDDTALINITVTGYILAQFDKTEYMKVKDIF